MTTTCKLIDSVVAHVETAGASTAGKRTAKQWTTHDPDLAAFSSPADVVGFCRQAAPRDKDRILRALLRIAPDDEWAQLTVLAVLAPRLRWVVSGWARRPGCRSELADLEAELVAGCLAIITTPQPGPPPLRPGLAVVDRAWVKVRDRRARDRRRAEHEAPPPEQRPLVASDSTPGPVLLAGRLNTAVAAGEVTPKEAQSIYLTRVTGLSTSEAAKALGTTPGVIRVLRCRAAERLAA